MKISAHHLTVQELAASYEVPEDQAARYRALTPYQRLKWLDEARRFTFLVRLSMKSAKVNHDAAKNT